MIGNVDEQPLNDKGIDPTNYERKFGAFTHLRIAVGGGVAIVDGEEDDTAEVGGDVGWVREGVLVHQAKIIR
jgi:hypothetical protein